MIATVAYWLAIFCVTHYPNAQQITPTFLVDTMADKVFHGTAFAGLAMLVAQTIAAHRVTRFDDRERATTSAALAASALTPLYAAADELTQPLVGRSCEASDLVYDLVGVACGIVIFLMLRRATSIRTADAS
jgi:VanZ family protein